MREQWKWVRGYEGAYKVSNLGAVTSVDRVVGHVTGEAHRRGRVLKPWLDSRGIYLYVTLSSEQTTENRSIHSLVADAFLARPDGATEVNHKDRDARNNRADNLEWMTKSENMHHSGQIKYTQEFCARVREDRERTGDSYAKLAARHGLSYPMQARKLCMRKVF